MLLKDKKYNFIYKTTNNITGKYYYGMHSTNNIDDGYLGSGKRLRYSINKYGKDNHIIEIIEFLPNRKSLIDKEKEVITLDEIAKENCMNLMIGGKGGFISKEQQQHRAICANKAMLLNRHTDPIRMESHKLVASNNMKECHRLGKIKYDTFTGKHHKIETIKLLSNAGKLKIGVRNSQYGTCWITKNGDNKKIKQEDLECYQQDGWTKGRNIAYIGYKTKK